MSRHAKGCQGTDPLLKRSLAVYLVQASGSIPLSQARQQNTAMAERAVSTSLPAQVQAALDESFRQVYASQRTALSAFRGVFAAVVTRELAALLAAPSTQSTHRVDVTTENTQSRRSSPLLRRSQSWSHVGDVAAAPSVAAHPEAEAEATQLSPDSLVARMRAKLMRAAHSDMPAANETRKRIVDLDVERSPSAGEALVAAAGADEAHLSTSGTEALTTFINREMQARLCIPPLPALASGRPCD
jgi:hypothetical protein